MKHKKILIQIAVGAVLAFLIMWGRGLFSAETAADRVLVVCDGCTVTAFLYLGMGALLWVSDTGFFDIFAYAVQKGAHALIPGRIHDNLPAYYDYKMQKQEKRKQRVGRSTLFTGLLFLIISILLTAVWYLLAG